MLAWGGNLYGVTGTGQTGTVGSTLVSLPAMFLQASTSDWNALVLTRPAAEPGSGTAGSGCPPWPTPR